MSYYDIDPQDIDPDTGRPYSNYSSPSLDTSFHDHEMGREDNELSSKMAELVERYGAVAVMASVERLTSEARECEHCGGDGIEPCGMSFDAGDGEGEDRPCSVCG